MGCLKWISVKERLPDKDSRSVLILAYDKESDMFLESEAKYLYSDYGDYKEEKWVNPAIGFPHEFTKYPNRLEILYWYPIPNYAGLRELLANRNKDNL